MPDSERLQRAQPGATVLELTSAERAAAGAAAVRDSELTRETARSAGIVHTPPELARFISRGADALLRSEVGLAEGLCDCRLALLDPACGPGAFAAAISAVQARIAVANAAELHVCDRDARALRLLREHLGEALDTATPLWTSHHCDVLAALLPGQVAALRPVLCVIGNPPWIGAQQPRPSAWLDALLEDFRRESDGTRLKERRLGVLSDAYIRFLRWACEAARLSKEGAALALVTNASYLDGPVHRALRVSLSAWFERISIVDLGGNALLARSSSTDENVFGVRPGVAVLFASRRAGGPSGGAAEVRYTRLLGSRRAKLERLAHAELHELTWQPLDPQPPLHRFVPRGPSSSEYERWPSLAEAMPFHREGVQTNRDAVVVDRTREQLALRLRAFASGARGAGLEAAWTPLFHYDPERARAAVAHALSLDPDGTAGLLVRPLAYRPFDLRWFAPIAPLCHRPRPDLLRAVDCSSFALVTVRKDRGEQVYRHVFAARMAIDNCLLSSRSSCRARAFPTHDPDGAENLAPHVAAAYASRVGRNVSSTEFAQYAIAQLASPVYRLRHQDALVVDYPRIPPPADARAFERGMRAGAELIELFIHPLDPDVAPDEDCAASSDSVAADALRIGHHHVLEQWARKGADARALSALAARGRRIAAVVSSLV